MTNIEARVLIVAMIVMAVVAVCTPMKDDVVLTHTYRVEAGDTLWKIAQMHPVRGVSTGELAFEIGEANDTGEYLHAGDVLMVP